MKENLNQEISNLLEKIHERYEKISRDGENISQEDAEALLSEVRELYEKVVVLNYSIINSEKMESRQEEHIMESPAETEKEEPGTENEMTEEPKEQIIPDEENGIDQEDEKEEKNSVEEPEGEPAEETEKTLPQMELFNTETKTLNENIAPKDKPPSVADRLERKSVSDLNTVIGINEKFTMISELFDGNEDDYNNSIKYLNGCKDQSEANEYIETNLKNKYTWKDDSESVAVFVDLVERLFK